MPNLFENPDKGEKAILVHIELAGTKESNDLHEFKELARSAGATPVAIVTGTRVVPDAKYFIGSGKAEEIKQQAAATGAKLIIFNHVLSPSQERNLETLIKGRVVDRTELILDIFAQRARTFEGKLQVELAQLQHLSTRLIRGWTHLERQKGGIGLRGPGETQLETDRRLIRNRIKLIRERLEKVQLQRAQNRRARQRAAIPTIAIVGYTNAGKSTLFNALTASSIFVADLPFATLDPTLRRLSLPEVGKIIMADTVGFIRNLPHDLVEAFKATLEETKQADLLIHVIDAHESDREVYIQAVDKVLAQMGAAELPHLHVMNKIDLLPNFEPRIDYDAGNLPRRVWISAAQNSGIDFLRQALVELIGKEMISCAVRLTPNEGKLRARLYEMSAVVSESDLEEGGWELLIRLPKAVYEKLPELQSLQSKTTIGKA